MFLGHATAVCLYPQPNPIESRSSGDISSCVCVRVCVCACVSLLIQVGVRLRTVISDVSCPTKVETRSAVASLVTAFPTRPGCLSGRSWVAGLPDICQASRQEIGLVSVARANKCHAGLSKRSMSKQPVRVDRASSPRRHLQRRPRNACACRAVGRSKEGQQRHVSPRCVTNAHRDAQLYLCFTRGHGLISRV